MLLIAAVFDLISLIPFVNVVSSVIAWMIFTVWFYFLGAGLLNPKKFATVSISFLAELIPLVSMLPMTFLGVGLLIFLQNNPLLGKLAHKGINIKKQALNKKVSGPDLNQKKPPIQDVKKKDSNQEDKGQPTKNVSTKKNMPPEVSTTMEKRPPTQETNKSTNITKETSQLASQDEKNSSSSDKTTKENNSEDQRADYEKNKESLKNLNYLENQMPQRRFIRDIDPPAPYGEEDQDEFNITT